MRRWARQRDSAVVERDTPPDAPHVVSRSDSIDPHLEDEVRRRRQPVDRARALVRLEPRALEPLAEERAAHRRVRDVVHAARLRRPRTYHTVYTERSTGMWRRTHTHARAGPANATRRRARLQRRELGRHALRRIARRLLFLLLHRERDPVVRRAAAATTTAGGRWDVAPRVEERDAAVHERRSHEDARCFAAVDAVAAAAAEARAQVAGDGAPAVPVGTAAAARAVVAPAACVGGGGVVVVVVVRVVGPAAGEQVVDRELDLTATVTLIWRSLVGS